jgi:hypothetical protein
LFKLCPCISIAVSSGAGHSPLWASVSSSVKWESNIYITGCLRRFSETKYKSLALGLTSSSIPQSCGSQASPHFSRKGAGVHHEKCIHVRDILLTVRQKSMSVLAGPAKPFREQESPAFISPKLRISQQHPETPSCLTCDPAPTHWSPCYTPSISRSRCSPH